MELGRQFRGSNALFTFGDLITGLGVIAGFALFFLGLKYLRNRQDKTRKHYCPRRLFRALCKLHNLNGREKALLKRTATAGSLKHPAQLFVSPELLSANAVRLSPQRQAKLRQVCMKLFGNVTTAG